MTDTHSHLYDTAFDADRAQVLARVRAAGVDTVMLPAIDSTTHEAMFALAREYADAAPRCLPMMGLHPTSVNDNPRWREELSLVEQFFENPPMRLWGVGETGIDLHWSRDFLREQSLAFRRQIELSLQYDLPLVIHARDAWPEVFAILEEYRNASDAIPSEPFHHVIPSETLDNVIARSERSERRGNLSATRYKTSSFRAAAGGVELFAEQTIAERASTVATAGSGGDIMRAKQSASAASPPKRRLSGIMHAFSGGVEEYQRARELGDFAFGISGVATYKRRPLDDVIRAMRLEDIVLETDSPYLTPEPHRGTRNDSSLLPLICARIASIRDTDAALIAAQTTLTARRIFGL